MLRRSQKRLLTMVTLIVHYTVTLSKSKETILQSNVIGDLFIAFQNRYFWYVLID